MYLKAQNTGLAVAAVFLCCAVACKPSGVRAASEGQDLSAQKILSLDDKNFLRNAEWTELRQKSLADAAMRISKNGDVYEFARQALADAHDALTNLAQLMSAKQIPQSAGLATDIQIETADRLSGVSGSAFNDKFLTLMIAEEQQAVKTFDSASETSADPDVRNYAGRFVTLFQRDLDRAAALQKKLEVAH